MTKDRKAELFCKLYNYIVETAEDGDKAHEILVRCGMTDNEVFNCSGNADATRYDDAEPDDIFESLENYADGFKDSVPGREYELYCSYIEKLKAGILLDIENAPRYIYEAEKQAYILDNRRRMTEDTTIDVYGVAAKHVKYALFDSKPFRK